MSNILRFFDNFQIIIYFTIGLVILVSARKAFLYWREWNKSVFGLEKENSQQKFNQALTILVFGVLLVSSLFVINTFVTPSVPGVHLLATPTIDLTQLPPTSTPAPTVIITGEGLIPTITSFFSRGCIPNQIDWTEPINGETIRGKMELKGTVNVQNLGFYKYEYAPVGTDMWTTIAAGNMTIQNAPLGGTWDTGALAPGEYELRLVVSDIANNALPACVILVVVEPLE